MSWTNRWRELVQSGMDEDAAAMLVQAEREAAERQPASTAQLIEASRHLDPDAVAVIQQELETRVSEARRRERDFQNAAFGIHVCYHDEEAA